MNIHAESASFLAVSAVAAVALSLSPSDAAQAPTRVAEATAVEEAPRIDGLVDDEVWTRADVISNFIQKEPVEGNEASEKTEVRILYDSQTIYVGVICFDDDPAGIIVTDARRDAALNDTDSFQLIFDTYHDRQNGFVFGTNPAGIEYDGQVTNEGEGGGGGVPALGRAQSGSGGGFNLNWDASFTVATNVGDYGWSAEFAIPLRSLRYGAGNPQTWGLNFQRNIRRKREEVYWSPVLRAWNLYRLSAAGELQGLELETPRNFKVTPYVLGASERDYTLDEPNDTRGDVGVDAKFGVTPSLNLDLTYNTDFAQVEVDAQQVNLTRFNLFFPEKRPFFLENAGNFSMGQSRAVELFFSRRIGIAAGQIVPILAGARLSGKAGSYNLGFLNMQTESLEHVTPANNYTVASLSRELPNRSSLGALFVNRIGTGSSAGEDNWNRTWGVDGKLGLGRYFTLTSYAARTETPNRSGREHAFSGRAEYQRSGGRIWLGYTEVGEEFNPEVGFLRRDAYRNLDTGWFLNLRNDISWLRELRPHITYQGYWDFDGFKETENIHFDSHVDFENGTYFSPAVNRTVEGLKVPFEITDGIFVAPGSYQHWELAWRWNTNLAAPLSYSGGVDAGGFLSGSRQSWETTVNFRYQSKVITSLSWSYNDVKLAEGSFVTNLIQARVSYNFTPLTYLQAFIQYNDDVDTWSSNIRFSWLNTAGTGLFVVYNDTEGLGNLFIGPQNRSLIVKYTHQFDILN
jgi:hypothetical protein